MVVLRLDEVTAGWVADAFDPWRWGLEFEMAVQKRATDRDGLGGRDE